MNKRKPRQKESRNFERDMALMRATAPVEVGGEGLTQKQAGERYGISAQAVQRTLAQPDMKEAHKDWLQKMFAKQRSRGENVNAAFDELVAAGDARVVIDYYRRMGVDIGPGIDVNIQELKLELPPGISDLLKLNPAYEEPEDAEVNDRSEEGREAESAAAPSTDE